MSFFTYRRNVFQIWLTVAGYDELCVGFKPIRDGEIFWMNEWMNNSNNNKNDDDDDDENRDSLFSL